MRPILRLSMIVFLLAWTILITGCTTTKIAGASPDLLSSLQFGRTTRQQVILKLGQPSATFEQESILTYRVGYDQQQGYYIISPKPCPPSLSSAQGTSWTNVHYSLVLVFDGDGILQKQNLVSVQ